ncbi:predicted protein [Uncinocarpus reesii 1704]|uniref:Uncharacterized protein n=1 Tax=Uncinocarpus reesii (strain UAMH 1704) TaxID=336963 RepID=C4JRM3_UNCRE|nr:uncharacterized protein UREG_05112 [Uncinocarpus reesii 1704]EEP80270.1 predicted protein [Uncinocarpus reesii 1704]
MRFSSKLYLLTALGLAGIVYFSWYLSLLPAAIIRSGNRQSQRWYRLVVFGDSWSDDDTVYKPTQKKFPCMLEITDESPDSSFGAIIDNSELEALQLNTTAKAPAADLSEQISEWLDKEERAARGAPRNQVSILKQSTIFVVSFGTWDLWKLAEQDLETAKISVERIVEKLFASLNGLAKKWSPGNTRIILSLPVDVTFLPAFKTRQGVVHKDGVVVSEHWHSQMRIHAEQWKHGSLFLLDTNSFLVDQVRDRQLWVGGLIEEEEFGKNGIAWENVNDPCIEIKNPPLKPTNCSDPEKFLFW